MTTIDLAEQSRLGSPAAPEVVDDAGYRALREDCVLSPRRGACYVRVQGAGAEDLLQAVASRDLEYLSPERGLVALLVSDTGQLVDQVVILRLDDYFLIECTTAGLPGVLAHLGEHADEVEVEDVSDRLHCVAVEGPYAWNAAGRIVPPELAALSLDTVIETTWRDEPLVFCRAGVTGEYGYKFIAAPSLVEAIAAELRSELVEIDDDVLAMAMLEVRHPQLVPGCDVAEVVDHGALWLVDPAKESYVGADPLRDAHAAATTVTVAFVAGSFAPVPIGTTVRTADDVEVGRVVLSGPSIGREGTIGLVAIDTDLSSVGLELEAGGVGLTTVASPFIVPQSWKTPIL